MWDYFRDVKLLLCPSATKPAGALVQGDSLHGGKFNATADWYDADDFDDAEFDVQLKNMVKPNGRHFLLSYGSNFWFTRDDSGGRTEEGLWGFAPGSILGAKNANRVPLVLDSAGGGSCPLPSDKPPEYDGQYYYSKPMNINEIRNFCINRHDGYVNVLFLDFSVRRVSLKGLWYIWWHRGWAIPYELSEPLDWNDPQHWMHDMPLEY